METETLETFLENLGLISSLDLFRKQNLDLDILKTLTEKDLKDVLVEIKLPIGDRIRIITKMKEFRDGGKYTSFSRNCIFVREGKM